MAATLLCDRIHQEIDSGKLVGVIYLDFTKAFDTIGRSLLLHKFTSYGVTGKELYWLTDYLYIIIGRNSLRSMDIEPVKNLFNPVFHKDLLWDRFYS